ncbi:MAG TPA: SGNH/GDSL hydrolase family protein [Acidimicrobiales bacterium]
MERPRKSMTGRATTVRDRGRDRARPRRSPEPGPRTVPVWSVVAVTAALLAASGVARAIDRPLVAPPGPVLLVGDSLFFQSANELERALRGDGWTVRTAAVPGAGIAGGGYVEGFRWPPELEEQVAQWRPTVAVVELGTNGCGTGCRSVPDAIDDVLAALHGVDLVLWLTVRTTAPRPGDPEAVNDHLEEAARTVVHLELLRYDRWFRGRSELVRPDGVHLTAEGQRALAHRVRAALRDRAGLS